MLLTGEKDNIEDQEDAIVSRTLESQDRRVQLVR